MGLTDAIVTWALAVLQAVDAALMRAVGNRGDELREGLRATGGVVRDRG
jgi:hypothetical protein